jgi:hypothetical protein
MKTCALALAVLLPLTSLRAQGGVLLQGIIDLEGWSTDTGSTFLTRNNGHPGGLARLQLWSAFEPLRGLVFYGLAEIEDGPALDGDERFEAALYQAGVRYTFSTAAVIDVGKMPSPVGAFAARRFSTRNPLIGEPDGYPTTYPAGIQFSGSMKQFDYRVAAVSLPVSHPGYVPDPEWAVRPAIGVGITPMVGLHLGASASWGPYLNGHVDASHLAGRSWQSYQQRLTALDAAFSRGYVELHGEWAQSGYDVPGASTVSGATWYGEAKVTLGPRLFAAVRYEDNNYPFILPVGQTTWIAVPVDFHNVEGGLGYRLSPLLIAKLSYRTDHWNLTPAQHSVLGPGGHALAFQLSQAFDVLSMFDGPR